MDLVGYTREAWKIFSFDYFKMMANMMKKMSKGDPKGGIPSEIFNQLK